ncbi:MAG: hypothetical protein U5L96_21990 [Owenweeksia sp.]|nr:hypothetical protein [Owenweeksia sp.]
MQKFIETKQYDKALVNLNQAIAQNPGNKLFTYIKGYILHTSMDSLELARQSYAKSIEADSAYLEPLYMMGLSFIDEANQISKEMNALPLNAQSKYKKLKSEQEEAFKKARPFLKKHMR